MPPGVPMVTPTPTVRERLRAHRELTALPEAEIDWILAHGDLRTVRTGQVLSSAAVGVTRDMLIVLSGRLVVWVGRARRAADWPAGSITGRYPFSRMATGVGEARVEEDGEIMAIDMDHFPAMIRECPELTATVVHLMVDRARLFTRHDLHDEKMVSLGRLAAGMAHELNNPAAALVRNAQVLETALYASDTAARDVGMRGPGSDVMTAAEAFRDQCMAAPDRPLSALERAARDEAIYEWVEERGFDPHLANLLTSTSTTVGQLDAFATRIAPELLEPIIRWVATTCNGLGLARELSQTATRISDLVGAVKGFTDMDSGMAPRQVVLEHGIRETVEVLSSRTREKDVRIDVSVPPDLPPVEAVRGELNQIWLKLLDNAIDAAPRASVVTVEATAAGDHVMVRVTDQGPGIPPEIGNRVFDPFFTTKPVGAGTGLGLDIARRLVVNLGGTIDFCREADRTVFEVVLPAAP